MIIVIGATHGIGRACTELLAVRGHRVLTTGWNAEADTRFGCQHR